MVQQWKWARVFVNIPSVQKRITFFFYVYNEFSIMFCTSFSLIKQWNLCTPKIKRKIPPATKKINTSVEFLELIWFLQGNNKTFFVFYNKNENYLWALDKFLLQTNKKKIITFSIFTGSKSNNMIVNIITWVT